MSRLYKAAVLGALTAMAGLVLSLTPAGRSIEEDLGLGLLFRLRGTRPAPSDVIIVSIDKISAENLNLPDNLRKWPRSVHARLIETLAGEGAAVIAFDIFFDEPHPGEDALFEKAMSKTQNVVLCGYLKNERVPLTAGGGTRTGELDIVKTAPPAPSLARAAVAFAPFPLPKVPVRVSRYWTFKTEAGDTPTLPVIAYHVFASGAGEEFIRLLGKVSPSEVGKLSSGNNTPFNAAGFVKLARVVRGIFEKEPLTGQWMLEELRNSNALSLDGKKDQTIRSLIKMFQAADTPYLNFYGPAQTIATVPYYRILQSPETTAADRSRPDVKGKAVFVGLSDLRTEQKDDFYTVFSQADGTDISGVELAATAFANLLEDMPVSQSGFYVRLAVIIFWGIALGIICRIFPAVVAALVVTGLCISYLVAAEYQFKTSGLWYPIVVPVLIQSPFAFSGSIMWKYIDSNRERRNIRKAFGYYLPEEIVDRLSKDVSALKADSRLVYGICLSTDAERYTSLSEDMGPRELGDFMNGYYETIFNPVKEHGGSVSNVIGDSMLAVWAATRPDPALRYQACLAALDISKAASRFNRSSGAMKLPTRIGFHSGRILLGNIGAGDHYEYRPVGDIVNTATRIEGLNKYLGTQILVSEEVVHKLDDFLTREIGEFLFVGKSRPLVVHELICHMEESDERRKTACDIFAGGLDMFRRRLWDGAMGKFNESVRILGNDGPSDFYLKLCERYKQNPPGDEWNGVVRMDKK